MLAIAPVFAAAPVSQATSNALTLSIAGSPISSGTVKATNDGTTETKTGATNPLIGVLGNQSLLNIGVLAQEADAKVANNGDGTSAACGGLAGEGAGFAANVGASNCLKPGTPVGISIANLNLTGATVIDPTSSIGSLSVLNPILSQILTPITSAISKALLPLGATGLGGTLGAVYAHCTAAPGTAEGSANIVDSKLTLSVAGKSIDLVHLPANPPPNTKVLTNLDVVLNTVLDGLKVDLNTTLNGLAAPLAAIVTTVQTQLVNTLIAQVASALAPLEQNVLDITLNKQTKTADTIDVTALDLKLLPAAAKFINGPLIGAQIGTVSCGPNAKKAVVTPTPTPTATPSVPTVVDSGLTGMSSQTDNTARDVLIATAALMMLAGSAGLIGYRRMLTK
jgi:hypothetical protein